MTVLSSIMGLVLPKLIPVAYTHILGGLLFLYFGVKLLLDAKGMEANRVSEELEEVEEELLHPKKADEESQDNVDSKNSIKQGFSEIAIQSFTLTFLAEWGDRSQIATIALSAAKNPYGVTLGGCIGHTMCTGLAVLGGRMLAARISEKTVNIFGGIIFLLFGIHSVFFES
jgi:putative Ca2+/H+ antiporter (TMEM165/GDT1 family)